MAVPSNTWDWDLQRFEKKNAAETTEDDPMAHDTQTQGMMSVSWMT